MEIDRYSTPEMKELWDVETKMELWAWVETNAAAVMGAPRTAVLGMRMAKVPTAEEVAEAEKTTRHDVAAFLQTWKAGMEPEAKRWVHRGMTSSDLVDTANAIRLRRASDWLIKDGRELLGKMIDHAIEHRWTPRVARTHGQYAELTTWGHRMADLAYLVDRAIKRLLAARRAVAVVKLSGPVGDYKDVTRRTEQELAMMLDLTVPSIASQVLARDGYADLVFACAQVAAAIENLAMEVRLSSRSDVGELTEGFKPGQIGSSAMPHKRNPILSENLCGLSRLVRSQIPAALECVTLHHERDISHSSVERVALPLVTNLTHFMLRRAANLVANLGVNRNRMLYHVGKAGMELHSAQIRTWLVANLGIDPDLAWDLVADAAQQESSEMLPHLKTNLRHRANLGEIEWPADVTWSDLTAHIYQNEREPGDKHIWADLERLKRSLALPG